MQLCVGTMVSPGRGGLLQAQAVSWDNVHINVTEPAQAAEWYVKNLGAAPVGFPGQGTQVKFRNVLVVFLKVQEQQRSARNIRKLKCAGI